MRPNGKFLPLIQGNLIEGLLAWFLLRRALRRVVSSSESEGGDPLPKIVRTKASRRGEHSRGRASGQIKSKEAEVRKRTT